MYLKIFNLQELPFQQRYDNKFVFYSHSHEECLTRLLYTVNENKEASLLTSMNGAGKSLLLSIFTETLRKNGYQVINIINANLPPEQFLEEVLWQMGHKRENRNKVEMLHLLQDLIQQNVEQDKETVVIVDEVQYVTDPTTFMEMHQLLNIRFNGKTCLTLILCGNQDFEKKIDNIGPLADRLVIRSKLDTLNLKDTGNYIHHRLKVAGCDKKVFDAGAIDVLYKTTHGIPRAINHLADLSMLIAASEGKTLIGSSVVQAAADEWQRVP